MQKTLSAVVLSVTTLTASLVAQAPRASSQALADMFPRTSYFAAQFAGLDACTAVADSLDVAKLIQAFVDGIPEETKEQMIDGQLDRIGEQLRREMARIGLAPSVLRNVLRRPHAWGVGRITIRGMGPSIAWVIDEGDAKADVEQLVATAFAMLHDLDRRFVLGEAAVAGLGCRTIEHPEGPVIYLARTHGRFIVTNSSGYLRDMMAVHDGQGASLATDTSFGSQRARLGAAPLLSGFVHTGTLLSILDEHLPYEATELGAALGIQNLTGIFAGVGGEGGSGVQLLDFGLQGDAGGLFKAAFSGPTDLAAAGMCSQDTVAFASMRVDVLRVVDGWQALMKVMPRAIAEEIEDNTRRSMARMLRHSGMTHAELRGLLASIEGSVSVAANLPSGGLPIPEGLVFLKLRDRAAVAPWVKRLAGIVASEARVEWKTRESGDHEIHYFDLRAAGAAITPSYVLTDDYLIVGSSTRTVLDALSCTAEDSLLTTEDFAKAAATEHGASGFVHLRLLRAAELGWRPLETMVASLMDQNADQLGFDGDALPEKDDFVDGLGAMTMSATIDEDGVRFRARGIMTFGSIVAGAAKLVDEVLVRASGKLY